MKKTWHFVRGDKDKEVTRKVSHPCSHSSFMANLELDLIKLPVARMKEEKTGLRERERERERERYRSSDAELRREGKC